MTEKANPSVTRPAEAFKTAGAIAYGGHGGDGFIVDGASPTQNSVQDADITEGNLNAFVESHSASSFDVTIDPGEAFVYGSWLAIDVSTTVTLASSTAGQTVYVGWNKDGSDDVIIGRSSDFAAASGDTDQKIPIWDFDTDGSGVTSSTDRRAIGYRQDETTFNEAVNFGSNKDVTLQYDGSVLSSTGAGWNVDTNDASFIVNSGADTFTVQANSDNGGRLVLGDNGTVGQTRVFVAFDPSTDSLNLQHTGDSHVRVNQNGPVEILSADLGLNDNNIDNVNDIHAGAGTTSYLRTNGSNWAIRDDGNGSVPLIYQESSFRVDMGAAEKMTLPSVSSDPSSNVGDMWYRTDLD